LFSNKIFSDEKRMIVAALSNPEGMTDLRRVDPKCVKCFREKSLSQFVTKKSLNLFTALKLEQGFLSTDPDVWEAREDFKTATQTVAAVRVVNDCAERAVKLATDYNMALTHDEEQRQLIFKSLNVIAGAFVLGLKLLLPRPRIRTFAVARSTGTDV